MTVDEVTEEIDQALGVDPFGCMPQWASRIVGLGGAEAPSDPTYVFRTVAIRPAVGEVTVHIHFHDCSASAGTLLIDVAAVSSVPGIQPARLRTIEVPLDRLVVENGTVDVMLNVRRNTLYSLSGYLKQGDLSASRIVITVDRRERPGMHGPGWRRRAEPIPVSLSDSAMVTSWMTSLETPTLGFPRSQPMTQRQLREPAYKKWMDALHRPIAPDPESWAQAYILEILDRHAMLTRGADGLGFVEETQELPAYLASLGCQILVAEHLEPRAFAAEPADALARFEDRAICQESVFSDQVHYAAFDFRHLTEPLCETVDFLWSNKVNRRFDLATYMSFIHLSINYLRPGGIAVHVFDFEYARRAENPSAMSRVEVERTALLQMSHLNDVVRPLFRSKQGSLELVREPTLYGLVIRRGGFEAEGRSEIPEE